MYLGNTSFFHRRAQKKAKNSAVFSWWAIRRVNPNQDYGAGVWDHIVVLLASGSEFWVWHLHFGSVTVQGHWGMFRGLQRMGKGREEEHIVGIICIFLNSTYLFCGTGDSMWSFVFLRGSAQGILVRVFSSTEPGLFLLDLSSIFYFTLTPALNYWIFQGSTISLDLWDEKEWQASLITRYLSLWH